MDAVEKVAGYTNKKEILQTTSITMVYLLQAEAVVTSAWDAEKQLIVPEAFHTAGKWQLPSSWYKPKTVADHPLFQRVQSLGHSAQFNLGGMSLPLKVLRQMEDAGIQSWVAFPLIGSDQSILGVVDVLVSNEPRVFADDEISLGALLAKLSSATYQRALLFERNEHKVRQLNAITELMSISSTYDGDARIDYSLSNIARVFAKTAEADYCVFSLYNAQKDELSKISCYQVRPESSPCSWPSERAAAAFPPAAEVIRKKKTTFFRLGESNLNPEVETFLQANNLGSLLILPLVSDNQLIGLVEIADEDPGLSYAAEEISMLQVIGRHTVRAINLHFSQQIQERARRYSEALVQAARTLNSSLNMNEVLARILEQLVVVVNCKSANIMLIEKERARLVKHIGYDDNPQSLKTLLYPLTTANLKSMYETRSAVLVQHTVKDPNWIVLEGDEWIQSYVGAPLLAGDEVIGFLNMDSDVPGFFTREILSSVEAFASIAASVIRNAQQYKNVQDRASELEIVRRATLSLTSSLDLEEVLSSILNQSLDLFTGTCDGHIFLYHSNLLSFGAAMRGDGTQGQIWSEPRKDGLTYTVARTGTPIIVDDLRTHPLFRNTPEDWVGSIIGLPLMYRDSVVGVMNIAHQEPYRFQDQQIRILNLLADQAAISIVNARLYNIVQEQSLTDPLTGLHNRRAFNRRLEEETLRSERYGRPFSLALMDLNGFKYINDTYGHLSGDQVLIEVGQCLSDNVRNTDFLARYGGDEFALIMPETSKQIATQMTNRLQRVLKTCEFGLPDNSLLPLTISIGIAQFPEHATVVEKLIAAADDALYQAKRLWNKEHNA